MATLLHEMKRRGKDCRFGVVSMCIGAHLSLYLSIYLSISRAHSMSHVQNLSFSCSHKCVVGRRCFDEYMYVNINAGTGMGAAAVFERGDACDELCNTRRIETNNLLSKDAR